MHKGWKKWSPGRAASGLGIKEHSSHCVLQSRRIWDWQSQQVADSIFTIWNLHYQIKNPTEGSSWIPCQSPRSRSLPPITRDQSLSVELDKSDYKADPTLNANIKLKQVRKNGDLSPPDEITHWYKFDHSNLLISPETLKSSSFWKRWCYGLLEEEMMTYCATGTASQSRLSSQWGGTGGVDIRKWVRSQCSVSLSRQQQGIGEWNVDESRIRIFFCEM